MKRERDHSSEWVNPSSRTVCWLHANACWLHANLSWINFYGKPAISKFADLSLDPEGLIIGD